jgi:predicted small lipoprotein YifL
MSSVRIAAVLLALATVASCGLRGSLERPPPMWGDERARYEAEMRAKAEAAEKAQKDAEEREKARTAAPATGPASPVSPTTPPKQ